MSSRAIPILTLLSIAILRAFAQDTSPLSAKTLYYQADADESTPAKAKPDAKPAQQAKATPKHSTPAASSVIAIPVVATTEHLGLRYNLLRYDRQTHKSTAVDPDHVFEQGDCIQVQLSPNRSGYLYVFDQGSSGKWQVLLPSALMGDEMNVIKAREAISIPANYCFTVENPSGTEHLFIVLSRSQEDMYSLDRAIRSKGATASPASPAPASAAPASPVMEAANKLDAEIQRMRSGLGSRDLGVEKVSEPDHPGEPENAVYVVNTSSASSSRLVTEILIRHR